MAEHEPSAAAVEKPADEALSSQEILISQAAASRPALVTRVDDSAPVSGRRPIEAFQSRTLGEKDYAPGRILAGRYRVERLLGEGAMGVVVAARHLELDELVAIKFIRPDMQRDAEVTARFAREAKASVRIKSEHVVKLLDVGVTMPIGPYIVMEYLEGRNLSEELVHGGPMAVPRAVECVMQACEALAAAHALGITHRDIKPENLFSTRHGEIEVIKLLDFGISKAVLSGRVFGDELVEERDESVLGTPLYMSPEQIQNTAAVDHRTDVWSLGVVLYELVTGVAAFAAEDVPKVCARVLNEQPEPLDTHVRSVPLALQRIVDRCLQKDPGQRFQDIGELARALMPFAPSRARLYAEFSTSVLRRSGVDWVSRDVSLRGERSDVATSLESDAAAVDAIDEPALIVSNTRRRRRTLVVGALLTLAALAASATMISRAGDAAAPVARASEPARPVLAAAMPAVAMTHVAAAGAPSVTHAAPTPSAAASTSAAPSASTRVEARQSKHAKRRATGSRRTRTVEVSEPTPAPSQISAEVPSAPPRRVRLVNDNGRGDSDGSRVRLVR
ncbi:MAG: serine/threonine-protein kinase [Polyangiaceae bacterium]